MKKAKTGKVSQNKKPHPDYESGYGKVGLTLSPPLAGRKITIGKLYSLNYPTHKSNEIKCFY
jgi:hypothetical protein